MSLGRGSRPESMVPPGLRWREWGLWRNPRPVIALILTTAVGTLVLASATLSAGRPQGSALTRLLILAVLAVFFDEASRTVDRLRLRITEGVFVDMTSVWLLAGAVVLPAAYAVLLVVAVRAHMWVRHQRRQGVPAHRQVFTAASMMLGCLACCAMVRHIAPDLESSPALVSALAVVAGLLVYTAINTALVAAAMFAAAPPQRLATVLGTWEDNALELATLCIGGLTALAVLHQPWLTVLALPPMFTLQRSALVKQLEQAASTDAKTGLLNAVAWEQLAKRELSRAERERRSAAVLIIDLDFFKTVNDRHGHLVGDMVLREVGHRMTGELRDYDTVGRFGGEEFVAVLPDVDVVAAGEVADRVRRRIGTLRPAALASGAATPNESPLTASIGVACYPAHGADIVQLLSAADAALYRAKDGGRNRVEIAGGGPPVAPEPAER